MKNLLFILFLSSICFAETHGIYGISRNYSIDKYVNGFIGFSFSKDFGLYDIGFLDAAISHNIKEIGGHTSITYAKWIIGFEARYDIRFDSEIVDDKMKVHDKRSKTVGLCFLCELANLKKFSVLYDIDNESVNFSFTNISW